MSDPTGENSVNLGNSASVESAEQLNPESDKFKDFEDLLMKRDDLFDRVMARKKAEIEDLLKKHRKSGDTGKENTSRANNSRDGESNSEQFVLNSTEQADNLNSNNKGASAALLRSPSNTMVFMPTADFFQGKESDGLRTNNIDQQLSSDELEFSSDESGLVEDKAKGDNLDPLSANMIRKYIEIQNNKEKDAVEKMIVDAECGKAQILKPPGNIDLSTAEIDDKFFHSSSHIDKKLKEKIERGEFVDLEKLLPKERVLHPGGKLNVINKDGRSYFVPANEKEPPTINSLKRWEQAFEAYATIYTNVHPDRSSEIFRYIYNIREAASMYIWDNVYSYDIKFHEMMHDYPQRNWG